VKADHRNLASCAVTIGAFSKGFDNINLHRPAWATAAAAALVAAVVLEAAVFAAVAASVGEIAADFAAELLLRDVALVVGAQLENENMV